MVYQIFILLSYTYVRLCTIDMYGVHIFCSLVINTMYVYNIVHLRSKLINCYITCVHCIINYLVHDYTVIFHTAKCKLYISSPENANQSYEVKNNMQSKLYAYLLNAFTVTYIKFLKF